MLAESQPQMQSTSSRYLIPTIEQVVAQAKLRLSQIDCIAVTIGPGSFSGLRVACTAAKTYAYVLNLPIVAINTLEVIAVQAAASVQTTRPKRIVATADAQRRQLFVQPFIPRGDSHWTQESDLTLVAYDQFSDRLACGDLITGPGLNLIDTCAIPPTIQIADAETFFPTARMTGLIGFDYLNRQHVTDCWRLQPKYGRMSAAEEKAIERRINQ